MRTGHGDGFNDDPVRHHGGGAFLQKELEKVSERRADLEAEMKRLEEARLRRVSGYCNRS